MKKDFRALLLVCLSLVVGQAKAAPRRLTLEGAQDLAEKYSAASVDYLINKGVIYRFHEDDELYINEERANRMLKAGSRRLDDDSTLNLLKDLLKGTTNVNRVDPGSAVMGTQDYVGTGPK